MAVSCGLVNGLTLRDKSTSLFGNNDCARDYVLIARKNYAIRHVLHGYHNAQNVLKREFDTESPEDKRGLINSGSNLIVT
jgi:hypothetical protein